MRVKCDIKSYWGEYYPLLYTEGAKIYCFNILTGKGKTPLTYKFDDKFCNRLDYYSTTHEGLGVAIEKYPDEKHINKLVLDFDGESGEKELVYEHVMEFSKYLQDLEISHFIEDSTNKGFHVFIFLGKDYNFNNSDDLYTAFCSRIVGEYNKFLDESNNHLKTNIRLLGSYHPKTGKCVSPVFFKDYGYDYHEFIDDSYIYSRNDIVKSRKEAKAKRKFRRVNINKDKSKLIDVRTLPWDGVGTNDGKSLWCLCPFHADSYPSLRVYEHGAYCVACGRKISYREILDHFGIE